MRHKYSFAAIAFARKLWEGQTLCDMHVIVHITQIIISFFAFRRRRLVKLAKWETVSGNDIFGDHGPSAPGYAHGDNVQFSYLFPDFMLEILTVM